MISFKPGVPGREVLSDKMNEALDKIDQVLTSEFRSILTVVTSTSDGKHMKNSKHYDVPCNAVDIRVWSILSSVCSVLRYHLGKDYDIVLEYKSPHIHVEYDPK